MKRFILINYYDNFSSICDSEEEVINGCGYDVEEITFEDLLEEVKGSYEIIEFNKKEWLNLISIDEFHEKYKFQYYHRI